MRPVLISLLTLVSALAFTPASADEKKLPDWQQSGSVEDGITVYRREVPGSSIIAFRGTGIVDAPIARVCGVIFDPARAPEWAQDIEESRVVRWISRPLEFIEYTHIGTPIVIKDRDFVSRVLVDVNAEAGTMRVRYEAIDDDSMPPGKYVRGDLTGSGFLLKSIENGTKTFIDGEVHADPKGAIPKWLVNLTQKSWPYKTLQAIRKQVKKPDIQEHAYFKAVFEKAVPAAPPATAAASQP